MAIVLADRVLETTTVTGTGSFTLTGAQIGYQSFSAIGNGNTTYYTIQGKNPDGTLTGEWEVGVGTYTTGSLARDTVLSNSLGTTAKIVFSAGAKDVFCDLPAEKVLAPSGTSSQLLANDGSGGLSNVTIGSNLTYSAGTLSATGGGGMTYPSAGIPNSTGTAWGTSYGVTGTGNVVLSTSPTLVTPVLGTPTSATLTNATGLPIVVGTTGTLSVARGGTGVTTKTGTGNVVLSVSPTISDAAIENSLRVGRPDGNSEAAPLNVSIGVSDTAFDRIVNISTGVGSISALDNVIIGADYNDTTAIVLYGKSIQLYGNSEGIIIDAGTGPNGLILQAQNIASLFTDGAPKTIHVGSDYGDGMEPPILDLKTITNFGYPATFNNTTNLSTLTASQAVFTDASKNLVSKAVTGTGSVVLNTLPTMSVTGTGFTLQDITDNTKQANFDLSALVTGTSYSYTLPTITGALATLGNITQTFAGVSTFSNTMTLNGSFTVNTPSTSLINIGGTSQTGALSIGRSTLGQTLTLGNNTSGSSTINIGRTSATLTINMAYGANSVSTKTINIGTGSTGGATNITIGEPTYATTTLIQGVFNQTVYTVATLPATTIGARSFVSDALAPVFGAIVVGGGAVLIPIYYDGTNWRVG